MELGPVPAVRKLFRRAGLDLNDFDIVESNEAFAAQAYASATNWALTLRRQIRTEAQLPLDIQWGATGAIILTKALYELQRTGGRRALCTMCIGGGQGIALAIERSH